MTSLRAFLTATRKALVTPSQRPSCLTFVTGNESADLDSLCSAILLAYFRSQTTPHTLHIPLANLHRDDLKLRPELLAVLRPAQLDTDDLLTLSDLPDLAPEATRWLLVDHNVLTGELARRFGSRVVGCIDHHTDEDSVPHGIPDAPRVIATAGSCVSLVLEHCRDAWDALEDHESDAALARMALAPILVDTVGLNSPDKTTPTDVRAVEYAEAKLRASGAASDYDRQAYWDEINELKEEICDMTFRDVLRKDYKEWTEGGLKLGMSTVPQGFDYILRKAAEDGVDPMAEFRAWTREQGLDLFGIMMISRPDGVFTRELLVWAFAPEGVAVAKHFEARYGGELELKRWGGGKLDGDEDGWRRCWTNAPRFSRKQVAPMLREAMKESSKL